MGVAIGLGCAEFPFSGAATYWRWIDMCEAGGVDSIWQTDRIVSRQPFLESMTTMAALAGRTRRMRFGMNVVLAGVSRPRAAGQAVRHHRRAVGRPPAAGLRHW
jgi:alkanesulfonate monooxygenase SsuD/methylene tetrahydromethanopterin reductase-like flavin-dependent oxidoreductase (luciferase family)